MKIACSSFNLTNNGKKILGTFFIFYSDIISNH